MREGNLPPWRHAAFLAWVAAFLVTASGGRAEGPAPASEEATAPEAAPFLDTITVTATSTPQRIEDTAATVGVVPRRQIEETLAGDLRDLLLFEPGVQVDGDASRLGLSGFNVRGIGGNRVATRIDGVPLPEQFAFGPLAAPRAAIDVDALQSVEILRSAGSALYGSDALGGVVSLVTRDPGDFLGGASRHLGASIGWDGRAEETAASAVAAAGGGRWSGSLLLDGRDGGPTESQGTLRTEDASRTASNPLDRRTFGGLGKLVFDPTDSWRLKLSAEVFRTDTEGEVFTSRTVQDLGAQMGPGVVYRLAIEDFDADDEVRRDRVALESFAQLDGPFADSLLARLYAQGSRTDQRVLELARTTLGGGPLGPVRTTVARRDGLFRFDQESLGAEVQAKKALAPAGIEHLVTYGLAWSRDRFDQLRDREDTDPSTGALLPSSAAYPTKYFPESEVDELGIYVQDEIALLAGRVRVVPGVRYDRTDLDADQNDAVFLHGNPGAPAPVDASHDALSPRLGVVVGATEAWSVFGQYARGFRTPPYSDVNVGFTNLTSGYTTLPNPDLDPETSDNLELGVRGSFARGSVSLALFDNRYRDFIERASLGVDPATGLLEFQSRNVSRARIRGVELAGDAHLGDAWSLRAAATWIEGENRVSGEPLDSVPPPRVVAGATYRPASRWRASLIASYLFAKDEDDIASTSQLATPDAFVVDATASIEIGSLILEGGLFNLLDETYWEWGDVLGVAPGPTADRYTSPGRTAAARVRFTF